MPEQQHNRTGRPIEVGGRFINCRHYKTTNGTEGIFLCAKKDTRKTTCEGCRTCPKCGSILFTCRLVQSRGRDRIYAEHEKSCLLCGVLIEEVLQAPLTMIPERKAPDVCQVHGCRNTAYEDCKHNEEVDGQQHSFRICETHRRRLKTWRLHPEKGEDQKPIIIEHGQLVDNPAYTRKQRRKRQGRKI